VRQADLGDGGGVGVPAAVVALLPGRIRLYEFDEVECVLHSCFIRDSFVLHACFIRASFVLFLKIHVADTRGLRRSASLTGPNTSFFRPWLRNTSAVLLLLHANARVLFCSQGIYGIAYMARNRARGYRRRGTRGGALPPLVLSAAFECFASITCYCT
jgi:hypothetical protein